MVYSLSLRTVATVLYN